MDDQVVLVYQIDNIMELPPGSKYLLEALPRFAIPSIITYLALYLLDKGNPSFNIPFWAAIVLAIAARPIILILSYYHSIWQNDRAAAANNAILPPSLPKSSLTIVSEFAWNSQHGYPGMPRSEYELQLFTDLLHGYD